MSLKDTGIEGRNKICNANKRRGIMNSKDGGISEKECPLWQD